jgi:outer membrane protein OmpA-like peptidoglycan-associated protein
MAELKKKVTLKRKSETVTAAPVPVKKKNKLLIPLIIIGLLAIVIGGYFLLKPSSTETMVAVDGSDQQATTQVSNNNPESSVQVSEQGAANDQTTVAAGTIEISSEETEAQPIANQANKVQETKDNQQKESNPSLVLPYQKGKSYKVYQFPFGVADYSQPNPELDKLVSVLKQNPSVKISISAFTDNVGDADYNQALSEQRAKAINDYLVRNGIDTSRLSYSGKGISTTYPSKAENRRAEFVLSN